MGEAPYWYQVLKVAQFLNCPPWEVEEHDDWFDWAYVALVAEAQAREAADQKRG